MFCSLPVSFFLRIISLFLPSQACVIKTMQIYGFFFAVAIPMVA